MGRVQNNKRGVQSVTDVGSLDIKKIHAGIYTVNLQIGNLDKTSEITATKL